MASHVYSVLIAPFFAAPDTLGQTVVGGHHQSAKADGGEL